MKHVIALGVLVALVTTASGQSSTASVTYPAKAGPGKGRHVVLLTGDEEYRSEEGLPMLAKILSQRHGFKTTVLFSLDPDGTINPKNAASLSDPAALDSADAIIMLLRFRHWSDEDMARFEKRLNAGTPIIALRTSTHAFNGFEKGSRWESWNYNNQGGFGKRVLGETWLTHWGRHKVEATRGAIEDGAREHPVLRGVTDLFGDTDVYEAYPPPDATILVRGVVLKELTPDSAPADYRKRRATDKQEQGVNDPPMPVVWTRHYKNDGGTTNRILTSTMGSATDLENEGLRRLIVNGVYWGLGLDVPARADVTYVDEYKPSFYGFDGFRKGLRPSDFELGKRVPGEPLPRPPRAPEAAPPTRLDQSNAGRWLWQRKRDLGAVVCHETIPGHHLEISLSLERPDAHLVTKPTGTSAFSEGWGLYAERLADEMKLYAGDVARLGRWQSRAYRASSWLPGCTRSAGRARRRSMS